MSQTTQTELNQVELMKQFIGTWKSTEKDTTYIWECKSFGKALEFAIKTETKEKVTIDASAGYMHASYKYDAQGEYEGGKDIISGFGIKIGFSIFL